MINCGNVGLCLVIFSLGGCAQIDALEKHGLELREARLAREKSGTTTTTTSSRRGLCAPFDFVSKHDIDAAYGVAMSNLKMRTVEERKQAAIARSSGFIDEGFKHTAQRGAYYRMGDWAQLPGPVKTSGWVNMELVRASPAGTTVKGDYCYMEDKLGADRRPELSVALRALF